MFNHLDVCCVFLHSHIHFFRMQHTCCAPHTHSTRVFIHKLHTRGPPNQWRPKPVAHFGNHIINNLDFNCVYIFIWPILQKHIAAAILTVCQHPWAQQSSRTTGHNTRAQVRFIIAHLRLRTYVMCSSVPFRTQQFRKKAQSLTRERAKLFRVPPMIKIRRARQFSRFALEWFTSAEKCARAAAPRVVDFETPLNIYWTIGCDAVMRVYIVFACTTSKPRCVWDIKLFCYWIHWLLLHQFFS